MLGINLENMQIRCSQTVEHLEEIEAFNQDVLKHIADWGKLEAERQDLLQAVEELEFGDFKKAVNAVKSWQLRHLQERLKLGARRDQLVASVMAELKSIRDARKADLEATRQRVADGLKAAGSGPEDSIAWKRGKTNQAARDFETLLNSTAAVVEGERALRAASNQWSEFPLKHREPTTEALRLELRGFIEGITAGL